MHAQLQVLLQPIVPTTRLPRVGVETQAQRLSEIVQLQPRRPERGHDRRVVDDLTGDPFTLRSEQEVRMRRRRGRIPDDEKGDVHLGRIGEDGIGFEFNSLTGGEDDFSAVEFFLRDEVGFWVSFVVSSCWTRGGD